MRGDGAKAGEKWWAECESVVGKKGMWEGRSEELGSNVSSEYRLAVGKAAHTTCRR